MAGLEEFTKQVCEDITNDVKDSMDEDSIDVLKKLVAQAITRHKKLLPAGSPAPAQASSGKSILSFKSKIETGKTTTVSAYNLHWNQWKEDNTQKEYPDPDDPTKKLTQHKYWQKYVWGKMDKKEREPWENEAKKAREEIKKSGGGKAKRKVSKSGFQLFLEKMKSKMEADEEFTHPENGQTVKLHHYLLYIWSNHVKTNDSLKQDFEDMARKLKDGELDDYDLADLPYLDPDKLRAQEFDDLEIVQEE